MNTGVNNIRTVDAIAISQSALRGIKFIGFEIKTSKSDFRNELKNVEKADEIAQYCKKWFIVATKNIISLTNFPENWGLLEATETRLKMTKEAKELNPIPPSREFVAMIVRRLENEIGMKKEYYRGYKEGREAQKKTNDRDMKWLNKKYEDLSKKLDDFKKSSGVDIWWWTENAGKEIGEIVKLILENKVEDRINHWEEQISKLLEEIRNAKKQLTKITEKKKKT